MREKKKPAGSYADVAGFSCTPVSLLGAFALASFLRDAVLFEDHQVFTEETAPCIAFRPAEGQRPFGMADIGVYGAAVYAKVTCGFAHRVCSFRDDFTKQLV